MKYNYHAIKCQKGKSQDVNTNFPNFDSVVGETDGTASASTSIASHLSDTD